MFQLGFSNGRGRGGVHRADGSAGELLFEAFQNGRELEKTALQPRGRQQYFFEQRDRFVFASNFSQRLNLPHGELADSRSR